MTEPTHPSNDLLLDVVLGHAPADASSEVAHHLAECRPCRTDYEELHTTLESILPAAPEATAPTGFESKVLEQLYPSQQSVPSGTSQQPRRIRAAALVAAACLLGIVIGGVSVYAYEHSITDDTEPSVAGTENAAELITAGGDVVGWAATGYDAEGPVVILTVDGGSAGETYTCRGVFADHSREVLSEWTVYDDQASIWVLDDSAEPLKGLELVDDSGQVWAKAQW